MPKKKDLTPEISELKQPVNTDELRRAAELISERASEMLDDGDIDPVEAAGHQALSTLLIMHTRGELPISFSMEMLKSVAEKKTPNPVTRIEQTHKVDLNTVFTKLVATGPDTLTRMAVLAKERASQVRLRLGTGEDYLLPIDASEQEISTPGVTRAEPVEVIDIRAGGDGNMKYNNLPPDPESTREVNAGLYTAPAGVSFADKYSKDEEVG